MRRSRKAGVSLAALGAVLLAASLFFTEDLTPDMGLRWNLENAEIVVVNDVEQSVMDLAEFRERYPQYDDLGDEEVARRLHARYFDKMPEEEFEKAFVVSGDPASGSGEPGGDPVMIRGDIVDIRPTEQFTRSVFVSDAIDFGLLALERRRTAFPLRYALYAALGLLAGGAVLASLSGAKRP